MTESEKVRYKLENELKVWDELVQEFRQWNREWDRFDARITHVRPLDSIKFMEKLDKKYNISKK